MLTAEQFSALAVGDLIETAPLLTGLSDEMIVLHTQAVTETEITFMATFYGVTLGQWTARKTDKGAVEWQTQ